MTDPERGYVFFFRVSCFCVGGFFLSGRGATKRYIMMIKPTPTAEMAIYVPLMV